MISDMIVHFAFSDDILLACQCAVCSKPMGDLLHSLFIHGGKVNCESCYSKAFDWLWELLRSLQPSPPSLYVDVTTDHLKSWDCSPCNLVKFLISQKFLTCVFVLLVVELVCLSRPWRICWQTKRALTLTFINSSYKKYFITKVLFCYSWYKSVHMYDTLLKNKTNAAV